MKKLVYGILVIQSLAAMNQGTLDPVLTGPTLKVLSLNTALLSVAFGIKELQPDCRLRAEAITRTILALPEDRRPDVIALQECFDTARVKEQLYNSAMRQRYPFAYIDDRWGAWLAGVNSGLVILSQHPILRAQRETYRQWTGDGAVNRKGIAGIEIDSQGRSFYIFTTHMQAGSSDRLSLKFLSKFFNRKRDGVDAATLSTDQIRLMELRQAQAFMTGFMAKRTAGPAVLVGDFNIDALDSSTFQDPLNPEHSLRVNESIERILGTGETFDAARSASEYSNYTDDDPLKRLDYGINVHSDQANVASYFVEDFTEAMSDHRGLMVEIDTFPAS